jgi:hypothetical protein
VRSHCITHHQRRADKNADSKDHKNQLKSNTKPHPEATQAFLAQLIFQVGNAQRMFFFNLEIYVAQLPAKQSCGLAGNFRVFHGGLMHYGGG